MVTMHDVLDAQWQMDNAKDGMQVVLLIVASTICVILFRIIYEKSN